MEERIQKLIARAGICSRRNAEEFIIQGRVKVNGVKAILGQKADPKTDEIMVDHRPLHSQKKRYFLLYKPKGYITTMSDEFHRPCVKDLFEKLNIREKLFTVGRLDYDSEGLMIATNDGELANKISHPRFEVQKTYKVILTSPVNERVEKRLLRGVVVEGKRVEISSLNLSDDRKQIELTIHEGRNRIVRKLMEKVGYSKLIRLIRIRIGGLELKNMREGQFREVTREELEREIKLQKKTSENKEGNTKTFVPEKEKPVKKEGEKSKSQLKRLAERQNRYRIKNRQ